MRFKSFFSGAVVTLTTLLSTQVGAGSAPANTSTDLLGHDSWTFDQNGLRHEPLHWRPATGSSQHQELQALASAAESNSGLFLPYTATSVGSWPEAVAIGDVNNDGKNDVVMTTSTYFDPTNDEHLFVFLQSNTGALNPPVKYPAGNGESVAIGDMNNDGRQDVVTTAADSVGVFLQNVSGGLDAMVTYPSGHSSFSNTYKVRVGDFNNDGLHDVASIDWGTQSQDVDVFLQNNTGTLSPPATYVVSHGGYDDLDVGDVNGDGLQDIIVMSGQLYAYDNIGVLLQQAATFASPVYYDLGGNELTAGVAVGDINGDALQDIVVTSGGNQPSASVGAFQQNGTGTLDPALSYPSYDIPESIEIGDVDNDGKKDIVVAHGGWTALGVYLQGAGGTLLPYEIYTIPYASHYNPHGVAVGDINGDGRIDVAIADYNNGLVVLRGNTARGFCKGSAPTVIGTPGNDTLIGTAARDVISGLGGNDVINGMGGNDLICAGLGNDTVSGGSGNERLYGEGGRDYLKGGSGRDLLNGGSSNDKMNGGSATDNCKGGSGRDTASSCETLSGVP